MEETRRFQKIDIYKEGLSQMAETREISLEEAAQLARQQAIQEGEDEVLVPVIDRTLAALTGASSGEQSQQEGKKQS